jgi:hypothetical protein
MRHSLRRTLVLFSFIQQNQKVTNLSLEKYIILFLIPAFFLQASSLLPAPATFGVAIRSSALLVAAKRKTLFEKANVAAMGLQNIKLPTLVFA